MDIAPISVSLADHLQNLGDTWPVAGHLALTSYELGDHTFELPHGIDYDIILTNTGDGILATGIVKASVAGTCDRCLEDAHFDIASEVNEYFLFEMPETVAEDEDEVDFSLIGDDNTIDLADAVNAAIIMETPFVVLCKEDCAGLCPTCGANLNNPGECTCNHDDDAIDPMNPFSVLAVLKRDVAEGELEAAFAQEEADLKAADDYAKTEELLEDDSTL